MSPGSPLLAVRLPLAGRQRTKPLSGSWLNRHPHFPLPPGRESRGRGSEGDCSLSFSLESNAPCFSRRSMHSLSYSSRGQDGLMRPLITHSFDNKISSPRAHLPPPSGAISRSVFCSTSPWSSPPTAGGHFSSSSELPPPTSRAARGPGLWAGVSPFLELLEGDEHTGLICSVSQMQNIVPGTQ